MAPPSNDGAAGDRNRSDQFPPPPPRSGDVLIGESADLNRSDESAPVSGSGDRRRGDLMRESADLNRSEESGPVFGTGDALTAGSEGGDLLMEEGVVQWLRALDLQVMGACRADERLKPLFKLSVSSGVAEERLVTQLNQHFEASEVGMLARCLCIPLVSIRVGKVYKLENLLCPSNTRGHLNLYLLPSSTMRISFTSDDGSIERLAIVTNDSESASVKIEEIAADGSGRSFMLKLPGSQVLYFWCSERSKPHGMELLSKMKDLLRKKPSLSHLTGICESRIDSFGNHVRAYLSGSSTPAQATSSTTSMSCDATRHASNVDLHSSSETLRGRPAVSRTTKVHPFFQVGLSPRAGTFKDGMPKSSLTNRNVVREKHRRRGDGSSSSSTLNSMLVTSTSPTAQVTTTSQSAMPCLPYPLPSCNHSGIKAHLSQFAVSSASRSCCWCPPYTLPLEYTVSSHLPIATTVSLPLPPLSSLLSSKAPPVSVFPSELPIDITGLPSHMKPSIFPKPLVHFPYPIPSNGIMPSSQQIPTFTPFMSDSIVHIPVIDVCSAGQGYLVSAEPALSLAVPPLLPTCASSHISQTESVEMNARETLRMLMGTAPTSACSPFMTMLPQVHNSLEDNLSYANVSKHETIAAGSRGFYGGVLDVKAVTGGLSLMILSSSAQNLAHADIEMRIASEIPEGSESAEIAGGSSCAEGNMLD